MEETPIGILGLPETSRADRLGERRTDTSVGIYQEDNVRLARQAMHQLPPPGISDGKGLARVRGVGYHNSASQALRSDAYNQHPR